MLQRRSAWDKMASMSQTLPAFPVFLLACLFGCPPIATAADGRAIEITGEQLAYFEKHIRPLFVEHCYECHSAEAGERQGGLFLDSRPGWEAGGDSGPVIVPGDAVASRLLQAVRYEDDDVQMPPDGELNARQIAHLENWVRTGAGRSSRGSQRSCRARRATV